MKPICEISLAYPTSDSDPYFELAVFEDNRILHSHTRRFHQSEHGAQSQAFAATAALVRELKLSGAYLLNNSRKRQFLTIRQLNMFAKS
jgi:hypothetical protein